MNLLEKPLIMGHYNIDLIKSLNPNVKVIAFYRNPIDRIISHVKHIIKHDKEWMGADPNDVIKARIKQIANLQTRMVHNAEARSMDAMLKNISRIDFIGIQEYFAESVHAMNYLFNWEIELIEMKNVSSNTLKESITPQSMSMICRNLKQEILIYDFACERFEKSRRGQQ